MLSANKWLFYRNARSYVKDWSAPRLVANRNHDAFWVADQGAPLTEEGLYQVVRKQTRAAFGKPMGLHDFRRAAATFIATEKPDRIGIVPGVLQHANATTASQHYNLANSAMASARYVGMIAERKAEALRRDAITDRSTALEPPGSLADLTKPVDSPSLFGDLEGTRR